MKIWFMEWSRFFFCVLEDGVPTIHGEFERYTREKEPKGDSFKLFKDVYKDESQNRLLGYYSPLDSFKDGSKRCVKVSDDFNHDIYGVGHQQMTLIGRHSSNFDEKAIVTFDGGGIELDDKKLNYYLER